MTFLVTTDVHSNPIMARRATATDDFDFHINAGDNTYWETTTEYALAFGDWHTRPFL